MNPNASTSKTYERLCECTQSDLAGEVLMLRSDLKYQKSETIRLSRLVKAMKLLAKELLK